jgi:hypothetical protein
MPDTMENGAAREAELMDGLFQVNKHLDNIYGQLNYDALLWNNWWKDMLFFAIKYPGWNIGSGRWMAAMAAGVKHGLTPGQQLSDYERLSLQMGLGLFINVGLHGNLLYLFINGKMPDDLSEIYFKGVWTGGYDRQGNKEYVTPASYWRDIRGMAPMDQNWGFAPGKPIQTVQAKLADITRIPMELLQNKEAFSRQQIFDPARPELWGLELAGYLGKQAVPYTTRQIKEMESGWGKYGGLVALARTPQRMTDTPLRQELRRYYESQRKDVVTIDDQAKRGQRRDIMNLAYEGRGREFLANLDELRRQGKIHYEQYRRLEKEGLEILHDPHWGPLRNSFERLPLAEAIRVYGMGSAEERAALHDLMEGKWRRARLETRRELEPEFNALWAVNQ